MPNKLNLSRYNTLGTSEKTMISISILKHLFV